MRRLLAALPILIAACGKPESGGSSSSSSGGSGSSQTRIAGGSAHEFKGVAFDLPASWNYNSAGRGLELIPEGANTSGVLEEKYAVVGHPQVTALEGEAFDNSIQKFLEQALPEGAQSSDERRKLGEFDGRILLFKSETGDGKAVEARVYAFLGPGSVWAVIALGYRELLEKRRSDVEAILASLAKSAPKTGTGGGKGGMRAELAGTWIRLADFQGNTGSYRQSDVLTLNADGTYVNKWETDSSNPFGSTGAQGHDSGTWTATDSEITFASESGGSSTVRLEKRNHPKNVNDPMIVLDGKAYVTAYRKDPW